jgi:hypothetical protein
MIAIIIIIRRNPLKLIRVARFIRILRLIHTRGSYSLIESKRAETNKWTAHSFIAAVLLLFAVFCRRNCVLFVIPEYIHSGVGRYFSLRLVPSWTYQGNTAPLSLAFRTTEPLTGLTGFSGVIFKQWFILRNVTCFPKISTEWYEKQ